ncbi:MULTISPECIES: hypothetical protein [Thermococcus]|uniref:Uncharacterized protein n=2 Tax=Thermococcus barophilus TaxID=55802 RepID=A0A0S1XCX3_THEBA|nr:MULTISPECIES: hypothetical protein [Thermococcus]ADT84436.1 hypothetical protein TERMP_01461 [Thermococcus barophilus MP]ALM75623.1 conserved membrane hypothetical protein [Thermococcus barophilus]WRS53543.1 hypothetical protein VFC49_05445 [Thermococcus sp. SY098]
MIDIILDVAIIGIALFLSFVSWIAYKKSGMKSILFLLLAFLLFGIKKTLENLHIIAGIKESTLDIVATVLELMILLLFFIAVVKMD